jgi:hypothetical protein
MRHHLRMTVVTAFISAVALLVPAGGLGEATHTTRITEYPIVTPAITCTDSEPVTLTGTARLIETFVEDASGRSHVMAVLVNVNVVGTGEQTGKTYRFVGMDSFISFGEPGSSEFLVRSSTGLQNYRFIVQGSVDNLEIFTLGHITMTPSGEITSFTFDTIACRG